MQKNKKRFWGIVGLAVVALMTVVACGIPASDASAVNAADVDVRVNVGEVNPSVHLDSPSDNESFIDGLIDVKTSFSHVRSLAYTLVYTNQAGQSVSVPVANYTVPNPDTNYDEHSFQLDLNKYAEFNEANGYRPSFRLICEATAVNGTKLPIDEVAFVYHAVDVVYNGAAQNSDPKLKAEINPLVNKLQIQVYDQQNNPLFINENGAETPFVVSRDQIDPETGALNITLPFEQYGIPSGTYQAVVVGYDGAGSILSIDTVAVPYDRNSGSIPGDGDGDGDGNTSGNPGDNGGDGQVTPGIPNTGSLLNDLNISRFDYILTGLITFGFVAGFAMYLIFRKNRR